jgi:hypothetical protein
VLIPSRSSDRLEMLAVERASARPLSLHGVLEIYMVLLARSSHSFELLAIERASTKLLFHMVIHIFSANAIAFLLMLIDTRH